jgi:hypothetical protein
MPIGVREFGGVLLRSVSCLLGGHEQPLAFHLKPLAFGDVLDGEENQGSSGSSARRKPIR